MNLTEFAQSRGLMHQTVSVYISRHPEFEGHTRREGKSVILDDEAIQMLEEKYPIPKPVQVVQGIDPDEHKRVQDELELVRKKYEATLEKVTQLQEEHLHDQKKIAEAEHQQLLIAEKKEELERINQLFLEEQGKVSELQTEKATLQTSMDFTTNALDLAQSGLKKAEEEKEQLKAELDRIKNRTLWQRIRNHF